MTSTTKRAREQPAQPGAYAAPEGRLPGDLGSPPVVSLVPPALQSRIQNLKSRIEAFSALVRLVRPFNFVLFLAGVGVGGLLAAEGTALREGEGLRLLVAAASAALLGGAANALNDVFDLEIDRVNRPERPLSSGRVSVGAAKGVWAAGTLAGVVAGALLSALHGVLAVAATVLLFVYNARLKRVPLAGNVLVGVVVALALVYGAAAVGAPEAAFVGAAFAFLTTLAREVVKDVEDLAGDAAAGARTLPIAFGKAVAERSAAAVVALTIALTPVPFLWLGYSSVYLLVVLAADVLMLRVLWLLQAGEAPGAIHRAGSLLKWAMVTGMLALALSGVPE